MSNRTLPLMLGVVVILMVAVVAVLAIVLLSDDDNGGTPTAPGSDTGGDSPQPGAPAVGGFCEDNFIRLQGSEPPTSLDPIQVRDTSAAEIVVEVFGGLVTLDTDLNVVPDLAESWEISPDGRVYTFRLRDNALFHNGTRVTAQDMKFSLERAADPQNASPTVLTYLGAIEGVADRFANRADEISGVQVIDDRTIQITITEPRDWFLKELTYPVAYVVDSSQIQRDPRGWIRQPNGTGPFRMVDFVPGQRIVLAANSRYHLGAPSLDQVIIDLAGGSLLTRYENDEVHIAFVPAIELEAVQAGTSPLSRDYTPQPQLTLMYLAFNSSEPPFDDPNVRQALAMTLDRERINDVLYFGTQRVADGITPPGIPGHDPSVTSYPYDPDEARRLIAESQYANNMPRIVLTFAGGGAVASPLLEAIQSLWRDELGIDVELQAVDFAAYLREVRRGTFQMYSAGWAADYPDPENFVDKLFAADSPQNELGYDNPEAQALIEEARREQDSERRFQLLAQAEQMIIDDAVVIPLIWPVDHQLVKPCVQNWPEIPMIVPRFRYVEIDPGAD
jgi:oligopeptide transport system substrate-binding protein